MPKRIEVGAGHEEKAHGRAVALIGQDGGEADARVVVDGDVQILLADAADFLAVSGDGVAGLRIRARRLMSKWIRSPGRGCS